MNCIYSMAGRDLLESDIWARGIVYLYGSIVVSRALCYVLYALEQVAHCRAGPTNSGMTSNKKSLILYLICVRVKPNERNSVRYVAIEIRLGLQKTIFYSVAYTKVTTSHPSLHPCQKDGRCEITTVISRMSRQTTHLRRRVARTRLLYETECSTNCTTQM